jgi:hypothetical protein
MFELKFALILMPWSKTFHTAMRMGMRLAHGDVSKLSLLESSDRQEYLSCPTKSLAA